MRGLIKKLSYRSKLLLNFAALFIVFAILLVCFQYHREKLYRWERKVFLMIESDRELQSAKEEYLAQQMTSEQVRQLSGKIERAKREKRKKRALVRIRSLSTMAAALVAALIILPNTTMGVANAMENIPFLGKLISVVTFRDYHYASSTPQAPRPLPPPAFL